ncbi:hypothetical protein [Nocardia neocaledoniensis]|uniref:hypothetical protein n=1 Tax=Nocardia neocaledoniensis TaxID=236511 RepID=UPI0024548C88|nr:hypothetical protein [Nocardia neocaledoniensis]
MNTTGIPTAHRIVRQRAFGRNVRAIQGIDGASLMFLPGGVITHVERLVWAVHATPIASRATPFADAAVGTVAAYDRGSSVA